MAERKPSKSGAQQPAKRSTGKAPLAKIAEMPEGDRAMAERLHAIIKASAPGISPRTWYGMPAYAMAMWPTSFALKELTAAEEARIGALVKRAVS